MVEAQGDPRDVYNRKVKKGAQCANITHTYLSHSSVLGLDQHLNRLKPPFSPSDIVHSPDKVANLLGGDEPPIHLGRPGGAPAAIFNPALAILQRKLEHLEQVEISRLDVERATKYLQCAVTFYKDEAQRQKAITGLVDEAIGEKGEWGRVLGWADNIKPDSCWWCYEFLILVLELKNTLGLSGDALLQAAIDYSKIVPQEKVRILISTASNLVAYLCCSTSAFGSTLISLLSSLVPLRIDSKFLLLFV